MPFEVLDELGRGGTGVVYRARDLETGAIVALKKLSPDVQSPEREVEMARRVHHPNVRRVYGLIRHDDGSVSISMEYVEGRSLHQFLADSGSLSTPDLMRIWRQMMNGLEATHRQGIVHRDLKPQNIFITPDGVIKLMDFGISRSETIPYTRPDFSGTPGYMAPEQVMGLTVDARADIYALGFIFYQMTYHSAGTPAHIESAIVRCLAKEPEKRFASVADLRRALTRRQRMREPGVYTGVLVLCLIVVLAVTLLLWQSTRAVIPKVLSAPPPPTAAPTAAPTASVTKASTSQPVVAVVFDGPTGEAFAAALVRGGKYRVVDRSVLQNVLSELKTRTEAGEIRESRRLLGADYFLVGSSRSFQGRLFINARMIQTETTEVVQARRVEGDPKATLKLAEELAAMF